MKFVYFESSCCTGRYVVLNKFLLNADSFALLLVLLFGEVKMHCWHFMWNFVSFSVCI